MVTADIGRIIAASWIQCKGLILGYAVDDWESELNFKAPPRFEPHRVRFCLYGKYWGLWPLGHLDHFNGERSRARLPRSPVNTSSAKTCACKHLDVWCRPCDPFSKNVLGLNPHKNRGFPTLVKPMSVIIPHFLAFRILKKDALN